LREVNVERGTTLVVRRCVYEEVVRRWVYEEVVRRWLGSSAESGR
jgi:hypothetical protein